jgi:membrane-bound lytic murein transglycosylase
VKLQGRLDVEARLLRQRTARVHVARQELVKDNSFRRIGLAAQIREWARTHPGEVQKYLDRNESYVFFTPIEGDPHGSLTCP